MKKSLWVILLAAVMILSSCANAMPEGPSGTGSGASADTLAQPDDTADDDTGEATFPQSETGTEDPETDVAVTDAETSGEPEDTYYDPAELWDAAARSAAIEKIKAALPVHNWETDRYSITLHFPRLYSEIASSRYITSTSEITLIDNYEGPKEVPAEFTVTVAQNAKDKELFIIFSCSKKFLGGSPAAIRVYEGGANISFSAGVNSYRESTCENEPLQFIDVFRSGTESLSRENANAFAEKIDQLLKSLDPSLSLSDLGIYGSFPETSPRPGSGLIFDDERYRATVETLTDGTGGTRLKIEDATGHFQYVLLSGNGRARVFAVAYKLKKGNIRVTVLQEYLKTDSEGVERYYITVRNIDLSDGTLFQTVPASAQAGKRPEGVFLDVQKAALRASKTATDILDIARTEGTEFLILADYYSDRPESDNLYMTPGELPEKADWKIGTELGLVTEW